jgi:hypothetical protein
VLLERGADAGALCDKGQTPYEASLQRGYREVADLLRKHGAGGERFDKFFHSSMISD